LLNRTHLLCSGYDDSANRDKDSRQSFDAVYTGGRPRCFAAMGRASGFERALEQALGHGIPAHDWVGTLGTAAIGLPGTEERPHPKAPPTTRVRRRDVDIRSVEDFIRCARGPNILHSGVGPRLRSASSSFTGVFQRLIARIPRGSPTAWVFWKCL